MARGAHCVRTEHRATLQPAPCGSSGRGGCLLSPQKESAPRSLAGCEAHVEDQATATVPVSPAIDNDQLAAIGTLFTAFDGRTLVRFELGAHIARLAANRYGVGLAATLLTPLRDPEGFRWELALSGEREGRRVIYIPPLVLLESLISEITFSLAAGVTRDWLPLIRRGVQQIADEVVERARYEVAFRRSVEP